MACEICLKASSNSFSSLFPFIQPSFMQLVDITKADATFHFLQCRINNTSQSWQSSIFLFPDQLVSSYVYKSILISDQLYLIIQLQLPLKGQLYGVWSHIGYKTLTFWNMLDAILITIFNWMQPKHLPQ